MWFSVGTGRTWQQQSIITHTTGKTIRSDGLVQHQRDPAPQTDFRRSIRRGGAGRIIAERMQDVPLDFGKRKQYGCFVGLQEVVVISDKDDMKAAAINLMCLFEDESFG